MVGSGTWSETIGSSSNGRAYDLMCRGSSKMLASRTYSRAGCGCDVATKNKGRGAEEQN